MPALSSVSLQVWPCQPGSDGNICHVTDEGTRLRELKRHAHKCTAGKTQGLEGRNHLLSYCRGPSVVFGGGNVNLPQYSCLETFHGLSSTRLLCPWGSPGKNTGVGRQTLLQGIFLTQGWTLGLLHCRQILYQLSHQGSPIILKTYYNSHFTLCGIKKIKHLNKQINKIQNQTSNQPGVTANSPTQEMRWPCQGIRWGLWGSVRLPQCQAMMRQARNLLPFCCLREFSSRGGQGGGVVLADPDRTWGKHPHFIHKVPPGTCPE